MIESRAHKLLALAVAALLSVPAFAVERAAPSVNIGGLNVRATNVGAGALTTLPAVTIPTIANLAIPGSINPSLAPQQAQPGAIEAMGQAVAPQIEAIAAPNVGAESAASSGESIQAILQGAKANDLVVTMSAGNPGSSGSGSGLSAPAGGSSNGSANVPSAPAPKASAPKSVNTRAGYSWRRAVLASISTFWGMNFSLPTAGPKLAQSVLKEASTKRVVFSDIDDTLGEYNKVGAVLSEDMARSIVAVRKAGKVFAAITDRPDVPRPNSTQKGAFQSFETIPADQRAGIILGTNGGGRIYEYDAAGEPKLIFEEPKLEQEVVDKISEAAKVVESELAANGTALKEGSHGPYGYSMILVGGTPEATVKKLAGRLQEELAARGLEFEVEGRMAKDPTLPPYLTFSKINKTVAVKAIAKLKGIEFDEAVAVGDSMYKPVDKPRGRNAAKMRKVGERLSGGAMPLTGNATDANMEKGLPGMLTISVGGTADPRMANAYVLPGKGASVTKQVVDAAASKPAAPSGPSRLASAGVLALFIMMGVVGWGTMYKAFYDVASGNYTSQPSDPQQPYIPPFSIEDVFGGR